MNPRLTGVHFFLLRLLPAVLSAPLLAGCPSGTPVGRVSGKVLLSDGSPLPGGLITFSSQDKMASAVIKPDGSYDARDVPVGPVQIGINNEHLSPKSALPANIKDRGPPKDVISNMGPPKDALKDKNPPSGATKQGTYVAIDPKYHSPDKSGLTYDVKKGDQVFDVTGISPL